MFITPLVGKKRFWFESDLFNALMCMVGIHGISPISDKYTFCPETVQDIVDMPTTQDTKMDCSVVYFCSKVEAFCGTMFMDEVLLFMQMPFINKSQTRTGLKGSKGQRRSNYTLSLLCQ